MWIIVYFSLFYAVPRDSGVWPGAQGLGITVWGFRAWGSGLSGFGFRVCS